MHGALYIDSTKQPFTVHANQQEVDPVTLKQLWGIPFVNISLIQK